MLNPLKVLPTSKTCMEVSVQGHLFVQRKPL